MKKTLFAFLVTISCAATAMGNKNVSLNPESSISEGRIKLGQKVAAANLKAKMPSPLFSKIATPLKKELSKSWGAKDPFKDTLNKADRFYESTSSVYLDFVKDMMAKAYATKFSESELKELLKIYESELMKKETEMLLTWFTEETIRAFKDPQIWQKYTQQFTGLFTAVLITGIQVATTVNTLNQAAVNDLDKTSKELGIDLKTSEGRSKFREKLKTTYPSLTPFIPVIESFIIGKAGY